MAVPRRLVLGVALFLSLRGSPPLRLPLWRLLTLHLARSALRSGVLPSSRSGECCPLRHVFSLSEALMDDEGLVRVCRPSVLKSGFIVKIMLLLSSGSRTPPQPPPPKKTNQKPKQPTPKKQNKKTPNLPDLCWSL